MQRYLGNIEWGIDDVIDNVDTTYNDILENVGIRETAVDKASTGEWFNHLTQRSRTVLELLNQGMERVQIAERIHCPVKALNRRIKWIINDARKYQII